MISAADAARNVTNYKMEQYKKVADTIEELLPKISASIEFHSQNGENTVTFCPYPKSRFPTAYDRETASNIFERVFRDHGYKIIQNDISRNVLEIRW